MPRTEDLSSAAEAALQGFTNEADHTFERGYGAKWENYDALSNTPWAIERDFELDLLRSAREEAIRHYRASRVKKGDSFTPPVFEDNSETEGSNQFKTTLTYTDGGRTVILKREARETDPEKPKDVTTYTYRREGAFGRKNVVSVQQGEYGAPSFTMVSTRRGVDVVALNGNKLSSSRGRRR